MNKDCIKKIMKEKCKKRTVRKLQEVYVAVSKTSCWGPLEPLCPDEHSALIVMPWLGKILLGFYCKDSMAAQNGKSN